jgi:sugar lactone lactonase YvrE
MAPPPAPPPQPPVEELPAAIVAERGGVVPEGIEYDQTHKRFLIGSINEGTVFSIDNAGKLTPLVQDSELKSSVGIEVDEPRNRLLVANADGAVFGGQGSGQAKLGIYALDTGARIAMVDLDDLVTTEGARFFVNDVTVAEDGSVYATDSFAGVVYRVDPGNTASLLVAPGVLPQGAFLNGIVAHPDGYLLAVDPQAGVLYRIPLDNPAALSTVALSQPINGGDGMVWHPDGSLLVVCNGASPIVALASSDGWASAQVARVGRFEGQGTTAAVAGEAVYVVLPHFMDQDPAQILRVDFQ